MSNDDLGSFIGATVRGLSITDTALNEAVWTKAELDPTERYYQGNTMFVNIDTDRGVLQFVAYSEHNGYYGHTAWVTSKQLTYEETL